MQIKNTIIYLIGFPGVGKYTVATRICALSAARLVDNHLVNNVVFSLIRRTDEKLSPVVWDNIGRIWDVVADTVTDLSHSDDSFVFTNVLLNDEADKDWYERVKSVAQKRAAMFVPVVLTCDVTQMMARVVSPGRGERMKLTDAGKLKKSLAEKQLLVFDHPNKLILETTTLSADETAQRIMAHCAKFDDGDLTRR